MTHQAHTGRHGGADDDTTLIPPVYHDPVTVPPDGGDHKPVAKPARPVSHRKTKPPRPVVIKPRRRLRWGVLAATLLGVVFVFLLGVGVGNGRLQLLPSVLSPAVSVSEPGRVDDGFDDGADVDVDGGKTEDPDLPTTTGRKPRD